MQDDVGLGDAADKTLGVQAIDYWQALRVGCGKLVKRFIHPLGGRDARKIARHYMSSLRTSETCDVTPTLR